MYYNKMIMDRIGSDKVLAVQLDHAFAGVKEGVIDSLNSMGDGATRILYYSSCLTDNYQGVCNKLKEEDKRFVLGVVQLVKKHDVIFHMIYLFVKVLLKHKTQWQKKNILKGVVSYTTNHSVGQVSDAALVYAITKTICYSHNMNIAVASALKEASESRIGYVALVLSSAGTLQHAADSANKLKNMYPQFYNALHEEILEMMYFLIEPIIMRNSYFNISTASDYKIAEALRNMMKS